MTYQETYQKWLNSSALDGAEKAELRAIAEDEKEKESRFYGPLEFGTAGLRGTMGVGLNRMNLHVIRHATQAFADVILAEGADQAARGVAVCFDCRHHSDEFARQAACVMAANGIPARLFEALRPTPELSFAVREYGCIAGINVTASHNPKEYNGYKVYWEDGAQLPPRHAAAIARRMEEIDIFTGVKTMDYQQAVQAGLITLMGEETDEKFLANVMAQVNDRKAVEQVADTFTMVYTPFHGTGYRLIPEALRRLGMKHVICVPQQMVVDGDFPTVVSPNPENPEGFALAIDLARQHNADFILGSDPDADRVGIMVRNRAGEYVTISGNQTGVLLLDYLIGAKLRAGTMPAHPVALKTIVTTEMARKVAETNGVACFDTFTGFKFMAEKKNALEAAGEGKVIFSYEESYGYMLGDYVRDKDAVTASLLLTEMAAWYAGQGMTLYDALEGLFEKYGFYGERTMNLVMPGLDGLKKMAALMAGLRETPPAEIAGVSVLQRKDYQDGSVIQVSTGAVSAMELSGSNVLRYELADGTSLIIRPSGTEPKVKVYILANGPDKAACEEKVSKYAAWAEELKRRP
jgi:phosphoglucomutase